jgi:hypothetical protein
MPGAARAVPDKDCGEAPGLDEALAVGFTWDRVPQPATKNTTAKTRMYGMELFIGFLPEKLF